MSTPGEQWMQNEIQKSFLRGYALGFLEGLEQARQDVIEEIMLPLLRRQLSDLDQRAEARARELTLEQLKRLAGVLLHFSSVEELTTWLAVK